MNLDQIRQFVTVVEEGSINRAAEKMFISQSSLSRSIKYLEQEQNEPLIIRNYRGIILTAFGQEFYEHAKALCNEYDCLSSKAITRGQRKRSFMRITSHSLTFVDQAFIDTYKQYEAENPSMALIKQGVSQSVYDVKHDLADIGITMKTSNSIERVIHFIEQNRLRYYPVASLQPSVFLSRNHPIVAAGKTQVCIKELLDYHFASNEEYFDRAEICEILRVSNPRKNNIFIEEREATFDFIFNTSAYTFAPLLKNYSDQISPKIDPISSKLVSLPIVDADFTFEIGYFSKKDADISNCCKTFLSILLSYFCRQQ